MKLGGATGFILPTETMKKRSRSDYKPLRVPRYWKEQGSKSEGERSATREQSGESGERAGSREQRAENIELKTLK
jgi:hypothetical protein